LTFEYIMTKIHQTPLKDVKFRNIPSKDHLLGI